MDFDFTSEQNHMRDAVRIWAEREYDFKRRHAILAEGGFSRAAYTSLASLGLTALYAPEGLDGLGMGAVEAMVAMEELGRGLVLEPIGQAWVCSDLLSRFAPMTLREAWVPTIASGQRIAVLAQHETLDRRDAAACATHAIPTSDGRYRLDGCKRLVAIPDVADLYLLPAMLGERLALFLVESGVEGVSVHTGRALDGGRVGTLVLQQASAEMICLDGTAAMRRSAALLIAAACAEGVGVMDRALALTVDYLRMRKQFSATIGSFQSLRHRLADMQMALELGRSMSYYATLMLDAPADEQQRALSRAKCQIGESMRFVGQQSIQLHGGIGMTDEHPVSHCFRRLTQLELMHGDMRYHLAQVSDAMQDVAGVIV